jgi:hypothetical protein
MKIGSNSVDPPFFSYFLPLSMELHERKSALASIRFETDDLSTAEATGTRAS